MKYPSLSLDGVSRFVTEVLVRVDLDQQIVDDFLAEHAESGDALDLSEVAAVARALFDDAAASGLTDKALEPLEGAHAGAVYGAMTALPLEALGSVDFWSYCSARYFWGFITLRQRATTLKARRALVRSMAAPPAEDDEELPQPLKRYVHGKDHYQIPLRLFLRAQAVGGDQSFLDAHPIDNGTDFWRSHILGVRTGSYPNWARPLVAAQSAERLKVDDQRPPARQINRLRVNISPILHDEVEAAAIITPFWVAPPEGQSVGGSKGKTKTKTKAKKTS